MLVPPSSWHYFFQQALDCWYRISLSTWEVNGWFQSFRNNFLKTRQHRKDVGWNEKHKFVIMSPVAAFVSQFLCFRVQGSLLTPDMEDEVWQVTLTSVPKALAEHSCLGNVPACYSCFPMLGSQGQHLQRIGGWWKQELSLKGGCSAGL